MFPTGTIAQKNYKRTVAVLLLRSLCRVHTKKNHILDKIEEDEQAVFIALFVVIRTIETNLGLTRVDEMIWM